MPELDLQGTAKGFRQPARVQVCRRWKEGMDRVRINPRDSLGHFSSLSCFLSCQFLAIWRIITLRVIALTKCFICITLHTAALSSRYHYYSHFFENFLQFVVIYTSKGFGVVNKEEVEVFLELSCFFNDPANVGTLSITLLACEMSAIVR